jgi:dTDP-glucose 4,6-dehydratase/UDP-glucose 4-epimerase
LAAVNGTEFFYSKPELVLEVAVKGMVNVLEACRAGGVRQLITASSSEVYQNPTAIPTDETVPLIVPDVLNPRYSYGGGKIISELLTLNYGRTHFDRAMVFRPHNVYGPDMGREHVIPQLILRMLQCRAAAGGAKRFDFPIQGDGLETRAYLFIEDMISGIVTLINHGQHLNIYHIGNPLETMVRDLVGEIAQQLDVDPVIVPGPLQPGSVKRRCPDISKIRRLGYVPEINLREGLKRTLPWYSSHAS